MKLVLQHVFLLVLSFAFSPVLAAEAAPQDSAAEPHDGIPVVFPALDHQYPELPSALGPPPPPAELAVLGTARKIGEGERGARHEIFIEKVLWGFCSRKSITVDGYLPDKDLRIFGLARTVDKSEGDDYTSPYSAPAEFEKAEIAFGKARLDYYALSSPWIFVGNEIEAHEGKRTVRVTKVLRGEGLKAGQEVEMDLSYRGVQDPLVQNELSLYCCSAKDDLDDHYQLAIRLPEKMEASVREALTRRDSYPVVAGEDGSNTEVRKIVFTGSTDEAIELLGFGDEANAMFIRQSLIHQGPRTRARLDEEIRQRMLSPDPDGAAERIQENLCRVLSVIDREGLAKILGERIASLEAAGTAEDATNASLLHLLTHLDDGLWLARHHGERLLPLPAKLGPRQKEVVESALAEVHLAERVELAAAVERTGLLPVVRTGTPQEPTAVGATIRFAEDPSRLRTVTRDGILHLRDAATLEVKSAIKLPEDHEFISTRPPDGSLALIAKVTKRSISGSPEEYGEMQVIEFDTGKLVAEIPLAVHWSYSNTHEFWLPDQELLILDDGKWHRVKLAAGKSSVETVDLDISNENELFNGMGELTEDGRSLFILDGGGKSPLLEVKQCDLATRALRTIGRIDLPLGRFFNEKGLVPGGRNFFVGDPGLSIHDRTSLKPAIPPLFPRDDLQAVTFTADGSKVVVATGERVFVDGVFDHDRDSETMVRVHDLATGKTLLAFPSPARRVRAMALSPDEKRLVLVRDDSVVESYQLPSFAR